MLHARSFLATDLSDGPRAGGDGDEEDDGGDAEAEGQLSVEVAEVFETDGRRFRTVVVSRRVLERMSR